ncbi:hypothetical protein H0A61_02156 [Koleobacter methoxysyntrophicus]|uniref:DUF5659 domain-containing protein n=1 Tax=Koleobacter methoxysyntrophicus TaxID=2751313 RepID=A0A8A0RMY8_9FIRM|nr:DUF5659 domain-containing protein [Koleobacter methoxysyntrophicus]QSQ09775.1 hypothetical protein H0A61_02156 [Koleobacter methoxysyntrophicus]
MNTKTVYTAKLARYLLRKGYRIVDIAPNFNDRKMTVFYFRNERELEKEIQKFIKSGTSKESI